MTRTKLSESQIGTNGDPWTAYTPTCTGWAATPTTTGTAYQRIGKTVFYRFIISGTSNSGIAKVQLPFPAQTTGGFSTEGALGLAQDNGTYLSTSCRMYIDPLSDPTVLACNKDMQGAGFTSSGAKTVRGLMIYEAA